MKLVEIKDGLWINPEMITSIGVDKSYKDGQERFGINFADNAPAVYWTGVREDLFYEVLKCLVQRVRQT